ncbi:peptide ABC transporter permease [Thioclava sp. SK-1]|uniref:DMT family transporter n=1 Tax=Thioclava sp. SK-1 TaxID=1889770 RepID=UPI00082526CC|nr:DMT family transporter [Thioclava sp. SK-1]OCX65782.1 peptide ABC transporter permease [Thioclava sp. SK-1]
MDLRAIFMGIVFALMWSSAFTSARMIVVDAPPLMALSARFFLSGAIGVAIALALGQTWRLTRAQWKSTAIFGLCQNALYLGLNFAAMQWVEASFASIIASTMPLMVAVLGWALFRDKLPMVGVAGLVLGVIGVGVIMGARLSGGADLMGVAFCFAGAMALSIATLSVRGASSGGNVLMIVGLQMLVGGVILAVVSALIEVHTINWNTQLILAFLYTTLVPGLIATWLWFKLVGRIGATRAATFHFLNPFFGVLIAWIVLGEQMGWSDLLGVAVICAGILAVQLSKRPTPVPAS